ncbi:MAG: TIGR00153 family protein [Candidatus Hatepunaea meridiana]|nr:TIGR00153 family protein [Candidatus Hatepunaea meridiana]
MTHILNLFRKSPFDPLYKHGLKVKECTDLVKPLFEAIFAGDLEKQNEISKRICDAEKQADLLKVEIRRIIPKGIFLAVNREDLLRYLKIQDDLADTTEDIAVLSSMKALYAPPDLQDEILAYVDTVLNVCTLADEATNQLQPIVEAGFKGENVESILDLAEQAEQAERNADDAGLRLAKKLFAHEDEMKATDIMLWFQIFDLLGDLADYADKTAEWLHNMLEK